MLSRSVEEFSALLFELRKNDLLGRATLIEAGGICVTLVPESPAPLVPTEPAKPTPPQDPETAREDVLFASGG